MAKSQEIAQIDEINKGLTSLNDTLNTTSERYLTLVKTISDSSKEIKDNVISFDNLGKAQKQTTDEGKKLDALGKQLAASEAKLKQTEDERLKTIIQNRIATQEATKALKDQVTLEKAAIGSIEKLTAENKKLYAEQRKLNLETEQGSKRNNEINNTINKNTNTIRANSSELVKLKMNVGNYPGAFKNIADAVESLPGPLGSAASSVKGFTTKLAAIGPTGALVAAGVLAISAPLVAFFTKSEKGAELLERKVAGLKAAFSVLTGELISGGEKMADAFDKPEKKAGKFWTVLATMISPAWTEVGTMMDMASFAMEKYTLGMQQLEDLERGMIVPRAEANLQIKEARLLYADETKSHEVRIAALQTALDLENKVTDDEIKNQNRKILLLAIANDEKKKAGQFRDEDDLKMQQALARSIELETESAGRQIRVAKTIAAAKKELYKEELAAITAVAELKEHNLEAEDKLKKTLTDKWNKSVEKEKNKEITDLELFNKIAEISGMKKVQTGLQQNKQITEDTKKKTDAITEYERNAAEERRQIAEDLRNNEFQLASEAINGIFNLNAAKFDQELNNLDKEKEAKLSNKKLTESQKEKIEAEYEKKSNAIKTKQAKADKLQAEFNIALDTFKGVMSAAAMPPLFAANPMIPWILAMGLLQAGLVAAQPIPKYAKGTQSADQRGIFGEAGPELMFMRSGDIALAEKPTYFEGSKFKGAQIFSNPETEKMIGMADRKVGGYQITDERLLNEMISVRKAIQNKPVAIFDKENRMIGQASSHSQTIYLNRLMRN
jgi:hypothetical protein